MRNHSLFLIIVLSLLLAACSQETDLTLQTNERWELKTTISLNLGVMPDVGGDIVGIGLSFDTGEISALAVETTLDQMVIYCENQGLQASWASGRGQRGSETAYKVTIKGQGWNQLSRLATPDPAMMSQLGTTGSENWPYALTVSDIGDGQLRFVMIVPQDTTGMSALMPVTFRLHGGKIISSNSRRVSGGVATWNGTQGTLEAVLTPASPVSPAVVVGLGIAGAGLVGGIVYVLITLTPKPHLSRLSLPRRPVPRRPIVRRPIVRRPPPRRSTHR